MPSLTPAVGWSDGLEALSYYRHFGFGYFTGLLTSTEGGSATQTLTTLPPEVRPKKRQSVILPIFPHQTSDPYDHSLALPIYYPASILPNGIVALDEPLPPQFYEHSLLLSLVTANARWLIEKAVDSPTEFAAFPISPDFEDKGAEYDYHQNRIHLKGEVKATVSGPTAHGTEENLMEIGNPPIAGDTDFRFSTALVAGKPIVVSLGLSAGPPFNSTLYLDGDFVKSSLLEPGPLVAVTTPKVDEKLVELERTGEIYECREDIFEFSVKTGGKCKFHKFNTCRAAPEPLFKGDIAIADFLLTEKEEEERGLLFFDWAYVALRIELAVGPLGTNSGCANDIVHHCPDGCGPNLLPNSVQFSKLGFGEPLWGLTYIGGPPEFGSSYGLPFIELSPGTSRYPTHYGGFPFLQRGLVKPPASLYTGPTGLPGSSPEPIDSPEFAQFLWHRSQMGAAFEAAGEFFGWFENKIVVRGQIIPFSERRQVGVHAGDVIDLSQTGWLFNRPANVEFGLEHGEQNVGIVSLEQDARAKQA